MLKTFIVCSACSIIAFRGQSQTITTIAGTGTEIDFGTQTSDTPVPATSMALKTPTGIGYDATGNVYFSDNGMYVVYKIDTKGQLSKYAGTGVSDEKGDGLAATAATLMQETITTDGNGNMYIVGFAGSTIRKVNAAGKISKIAGTGKQNPGQGHKNAGKAALSCDLAITGNIVADKKGNTYMNDYASESNLKLNASGTFSAFAVDPKLYDEGATTNNSGMATDGAGNLYVADDNVFKIFKMTPEGKWSLFAGTGEEGGDGDGGPATAAKLNYTNGIMAADPSGNLFVYDTAKHSIRKIAKNGTISTIAGNGSMGAAGDGGPAKSAAIDMPFAMCADDKGNLYFTDQRNFRVRKISGIK